LEHLVNSLLRNHYIGDYEGFRNGDLNGGTGIFLLEILQGNPCFLGNLGENIQPEIVNNEG
jgi:hypothetical protein